MAFQDITLTCKDCGEEFTFTAEEQEFYKEKGFENQPQRCKACRMKKKQAFNGAREMHEVTCAECGAETTVPFNPTAGKPVYCRDCFQKHREAA